MNRSVFVVCKGRPSLERWGRVKRHFALDVDAVVVVVVVVRLLSDQAVVSDVIRRCFGVRVERPLREIRLTAFVDTLLERVLLFWERLLGPVRSPHSWLQTKLFHLFLD